MLWVNISVGLRSEALASCPFLVVIIHLSYRKRMTGSVTSMAKLGHEPDKISESSGRLF